MMTFLWLDQGGDGYRLYELTEIMNTGLIGGSRAMRAAAEMFGYNAGCP
jgi:hypothetical protein